MRFENPENRFIARELENALKDDQWRKAYDEFLQTPEWKEISNYVKRRDGNTCQACGRHDNPNNLFAHHLTYQYGFAPPLWHLMTACLGCHQRLHADKYGLQDPWCPRSIE